MMAGASLAAPFGTTTTASPAGAQPTWSGRFSSIKSWNGAALRHTHLAWRQAAKRLTRHVTTRRIRMEAETEQQAAQHGLRPHLSRNMKGDFLLIVGGKTDCIGAKCGSPL